MRRRRTSPPKWQAKPGHMLFYNKEVPVAVAERHAKMLMRGFDKLPRKKRDQLNFVLPEDITPGSKRS
jgi:hypothetical protein